MSTAETTPVASTEDNGLDLRVLVVVLAILLMVGVPLLRIANGGPTRFGWQMFSHSSAPPVFSVVPESGETYEVDVRDVVARPRGDLPFVDVVPPHLCAIDPDARSVIITFDGNSETFRC